MKQKQKTHKNRQKQQTNKNIMKNIKLLKMVL